MKKINAIILAIAIICLVSGSYAVYLGNHDNTDTSDAPQIIPGDGTLNKDDKVLINEELKTQSANNEIASSVIANPIQHSQISENNLAVSPKNIYGDRYLQCAVCLGFLPTGNVTKALPQGILCDGLCGGVVNYSHINYDNTCSYDEVYEYWLEHGDVSRPVSEPNAPYVPHEDSNVNNQNSYGESNLPEGVTYHILPFNVA